MDIVPSAPTLVKSKDYMSVWPQLQSMKNILSPIRSLGEANGNPLQSSWLENPMDRGVWGAADYGVAQSQTWLKRFSSNSRSLGISIGPEDGRSSFLHVNGKI